MRASSLVWRVAVAILAITACARADAIQKWQAPDGSLYFGDRPPSGSTLLETIPDSPTRETIAAPEIDSELTKAAAEGREIIRQRESARAEERKADAERAERFEAASASFEPDYGFLPYIFVDSFPRGCASGAPCFDGHHGNRFPNHDHVGHHHHDGGMSLFQTVQPRLQRPPRVIGMGSAHLNSNSSSGNHHRRPGS